MPPALDTIRSCTMLAHVREHASPFGGLRRPAMRRPVTKSSARAPCLRHVTAQAFDALRCLHAAVVHGDVAVGNLVWDPSGHHFQFADLEFATWAAEEGQAGEVVDHVDSSTGGSTRVVSAALAVAPLADDAHGSTPAVRLAPHGTLEVASVSVLKGYASVRCTSPLALLCMCARACMCALLCSQCRCKQIRTLSTRSWKVRSLKMEAPNVLV